MKYSLIVSLLILPFILFSQRYEVGDIWHYNQYLIFEGDDFRTIEVSNSSVMDGRNYFELKGSCNCGMFSLSEFYLEDNRIFRLDQDSGQYTLLYDFNLNTGDTLEIRVNEQFSPARWLIDSVSYITVSDSILKVQHIKVLDENFVVYFGDKIIQYMGSDYCFAPVFGTCDPATGPLRCFNSSNLSYNFNPQIDCDSTKIINSISSLTKNKYAVFPNPFTEKLTIKTDLPSSNTTVQIYNSTSVNVAETSFNGNSEILDLSQLPSGIYFLSIRSNDFLEIKKIVKE